MSDHAPGTSGSRQDDVVLDRRDFLRLAGASLAIAGLDGCTRLPANNILPYVDSRPELAGGNVLRYATSMCIDGFATGLVVESHTGRPTKVEGNPEHPASLGASGPLEQASVLQLYDPDRARTSRLGQETSSWSTVAATLAPEQLRSRLELHGRGLHLLIEPTSSPLDEDLLARVASTHPEAQLHMYGPLITERANNAYVQDYDFSAVDVVLAVDSDFLSSGPFHLRYARQFADGRRLANTDHAMNRLYVIESSFTPTGSAADHRFAARPSDFLPLLHALLAHITGAEGNAGGPRWLQAIARDLLSHPGRSVVVLGASHSSEAQALVGAINSALGAYAGATWHTPTPLIGTRAPLRPFADLLSALEKHTVTTLIIVGGNPAYTTPASVGFATLVADVPDVVYVGLYENETARVADLFAPLSHYLERWGDARAYNGTLSIVQPLIKPLYQSIAPGTVYAALAGVPAGDLQSYALLRDSWDAREEGEPAMAWHDVLQRGFVPGTAFAPVAVPATVPGSISRSGRVDVDGMDVLYRPDHKVHDGSFSNNGWLQELPGPLTQLTWGNAAMLSPATARRIEVSNGDLVTLSADLRRLTLPALVIPGHADESITLTFGYGRSGVESAARGVGANAYQLWPAIGARFERGVTVRREGGTRALAIDQTHDAMEVSKPVRTTTLLEYTQAPTKVGRPSGRSLSLFPDHAPPIGRPDINQWAMTIDLGTCIGCGACVVACQAENNIPVVGADEVRRGRAMQWIHIDRYFAAREDSIDALLQPMLCQHCEKAPCEYVCPVGATVHSPDGLNEMVYNRCVGTRFCSNNCPYKVRRFNWFDYNENLAETEQMVKNPNVTVRERGVMEKCTFCVQRIRSAEIEAGREGHPLDASEVRTACQQACPTNAIVFGSLTDPESEMVQRRQQPRAYAVLDELGTEPRVLYLARVRNANPDVTSGR